MGGETHAIDAVCQGKQGPSPRGRGNHADGRGDPVRQGAIPAWAGKPPCAQPRPIPRQGHPRVGGETRCRRRLPWCCWGPSPRGRGNLHSLRHHQSANGAIPAWAGKPGTEAGWRAPPPGHPRVGGETFSSQSINEGRNGPSPRGRGNHKRSSTTSAASRAIPAWAGKPPRLPCLPAHFQGHPRVGGETPAILGCFRAAPGPSPRGRGNRSMKGHHDPRPRAIPAWAGKPRPVPGTSGAMRGHPRVGGETGLGVFHRNRLQGPSPRGRGNLFIGNDRFLTGRAIPAWAGKPPPRSQPQGHGGGHPRVGGETVRAHGHVVFAAGPSPRGRGNRRVFASVAKQGGAIPAWAGKPSRLRIGLSAFRGHPRVGGETKGQYGALIRASGPSPRGRGNRQSGDPIPPSAGAIPAWAGKPGRRQGEAPY